MKTTEYKILHYDDGTESIIKIKSDMLKNPSETIQWKWTDHPNNEDIKELTFTNIPDRIIFDPNNNGPMDLLIIDKFKITYKNEEYKVLFKSDEHEPAIIDNDLNNDLDNDHYENIITIFVWGSNKQFREIKIKVEKQNVELIEKALNKFKKRYESNRI